MTARWLENGALAVPRRLGSTEVACVMAFYIPELALELPKNKTLGDVYARLKWGIETPRNARMKRGNTVEPIALDYYREHVGPAWRPIPDGEFWTIQHPRYEWATASPDAVDSPEHRLVIEAKSQSEWARPQWGLPGGDQMATRYLYQCAWLMACADAEETHVLCMFGHDTKTEAGDDYFEITEPALYRVARDAHVESELLAHGERFVNEFLLPGIPPPVQPSNNKRKMKEALKNERGEDAVREWLQRCEERNQALAGAQGSGGDGDSGPDSEVRDE